MHPAYSLSNAVAFALVVVATATPGSEAHGRNAVPGVARGAGVYACVQGGHRVYADRPCTPAAIVLEVPIPASAAPEAGAAERARPADAPGAQRAGRSTGSRADDRPRTIPHSARPRAGAGVNGLPAPESARCRSLRTSLARLDARMRAGYAAAEGEALRARHRALRAARHAARCR